MALGHQEPLKMPETIQPEPPVKARTRSASRAKAAPKANAQEPIKMPVTIQPEPLVRGRTRSVPRAKTPLKQQLDQRVCLRHDPVQLWRSRLPMMTGLRARDREIEHAVRLACHLLCCTPKIPKSKKKTIGECAASGIFPKVPPYRAVPAKPKGEK